jgi:chemotaxis protein CheD
MISRMLNINEVAVTNKPVEFVCYGLSSCIALFITDNSKKISGGAHIAMPAKNPDSMLKGADELVDELLAGLKGLGSDLTTLRAKITGGAQVLSTSSMGQPNTLAVQQLLMSRNIYIAASDVGGKVSRTARFNSITQQLTISTSEPKNYTV